MTQQFSPMQRETLPCMEYKTPAASMELSAVVYWLGKQMTLFWINLRLFNKHTDTSICTQRNEYEYQGQPTVSAGKTQCYDCQCVTNNSAEGYSEGEGANMYYTHRWMGEERLVDSETGGEIKWSDISTSIMHFPQQHVWTELKLKY